MTIHALSQPFGVAVGGGSVWVTEYTAGRLARISPQSNLVVDRFDLGGKASDVVFDSGAAWVTVQGRDGSDRIARVDATTGAVTSVALGTGATPIGIASGAGSLWVAEQNRGAVVRIDPLTAQVQATVQVDFGPYGVAVGGGAVWTANRFAATVSRVDTGSLRATSHATGHRPSGVIAFGDGSAWVGNDDGFLSRLDASSGEVQAAYQVGSPDWASIAVTPTVVWIAAPLDNEVARVDPATGNVLGTIHTGARPQGLALDGPNLWVANYADGTLVKLGAV